MSGTPSPGTPGSDQDYLETIENMDDVMIEAYWKQRNEEILSMIRSRKTSGMAAYRWVLVRQVLPYIICAIAGWIICVLIGG